MSTVTGTANFAQSSFPEFIRPNVPQIIGAINLISAIMTTIYQFLKISEYMESHRISAINYGKVSRNITVELNLPIKDRSTGGAECVKVIRNEIDRLIEQSPSIPKSILYKYTNTFHDSEIAEPEIITIKRVDIYADQLKHDVGSSTIDDILLYKKRPEQVPEQVKPLTPPSPKTVKANLQNELNSLCALNLVKNKRKVVINDLPEIHMEEGYAEKKPEIIVEQVLNELVDQVVVETESLTSSVVSQV